MLILYLWTLWNMKPRRENKDHLLCSAVKKPLAKCVCEQCKNQNKKAVLWLVSNRRKRYKRVPVSNLLEKAWCWSMRDVTFNLSAWETQPFVPCRLLYKLQLTSCSKKKLVAMVPRWISICLEVLLCRDFTETSLILLMREPHLHAYNGIRLFQLPKVIRTMLCFEWGTGGGACCFLFHTI